MGKGDHEGGGRKEKKERRETPSSIRKKRNQQRSRKGLKARVKSKKPSWTEAMKKSYTKKKKDPTATGEVGEGLKMDEMDEDGIEVQEDIDEEKQEKLNKDTPLDTQLFLRGIPPDTNDEEVRDFFSRFGAIKRVLLVKNKITKRPAGTAFIHFKTKDIADKVIVHGQQNAREAQAEVREKEKDLTGKLSHHQAKKMKYKLNKTDDNINQANKDPFVDFKNNKVFLFRAISRIESQDLVSQAKKKKNRTKVAADDPRNLYLLQEGLVEPNTPAAVGLNPQYVEMIQGDYESRKQQLKNINMFVSKTRLSIRNFPKKEEEKDLRNLCAKFARNYLKKHPEDLDREAFGKFGPIKMCKLLTDSSGVSRGFGFVEFVNHNVALSVLRMLNNNPTVYGPRNRLVVNFAIENVNALQKLERIRDKKRTRLQSAGEEADYQ